MLKISKEVDYALILMTQLASKPTNYYSINSLAAIHHLPYKFLSQIALKLKQSGLIEAKEGSGGGYRLAKEPSQINILNIITAIEGEVAPVACQQGKTCASKDSCQHSQMISQLSVLVSNFLSSQSLAQFVPRSLHAFH
jgi:Rrf2 family protein